MVDGWGGDYLDMRLSIYPDIYMNLSKKAARQLGRHLALKLAHKVLSVARCTLHAMS